MDHLGSLQQVLVPPIQRLGLAQGSKVSVSVKAYQVHGFPCASSVGV